MVEWGLQDKPIEWGLGDAPTAILPLDPIEEERQIKASVDMSDRKSLPVGTIDSNYAIYAGEDKNQKKIDGFINRYAAAGMGGFSPRITRETAIDIPVRPVRIAKEIAAGVARFIESGVGSTFGGTAYDWLGQFIEQGGYAVDQFSKIGTKNKDQVYNPFAESIIATGQNISKWGKESRKAWAEQAAYGWEALDPELKKSDPISYGAGRISEGVTSSALSVLSVYLSGGAAAPALLNKGFQINRGLIALSTMSAAGGFQHAQEQGENFYWSTVQGLADGGIEYAMETSFLEGVGKGKSAITAGFKEGGEEFFTGMLQNTRAGMLENENKGMTAYKGAKDAIKKALIQSPWEVAAGFIGGSGIQGGANLTEIVKSWKTDVPVDVPTTSADGGIKLAPPTEEAPTKAVKPTEPVAKPKEAKEPTITPAKGEVVDFKPVRHFEGGFSDRLTLDSLPPVKEGKVRLYRAETGVQTETVKGDIETFGQEDRGTGGWFTTDIQYALNFYEGAYGDIKKADRKMSYMDVSEQSAKEHFVGNIEGTKDEYFFPELREAPAKAAEVEGEVKTIKTSIGNIEIPTEDLDVKWDQALEVIFNYGNQEAAGKPNQFDLSRSLSMGDTVEYEGKTWLIMPSGWQDVSHLSQEGIDKIVGEAKIPIPPKPTPAKAAEVEGEAISLAGGERGGTVIHPSARVKGKIQATTFTEDGRPSGHKEYDTLEEALFANYHDIDSPIFRPLKKAENAIKLIKIWEKAKFDSPLSPDTKGKNFAYISPLRPLSGVSNLDGVVIDVDNVGVVFNNSPLEDSQIKHLSLVPITHEAIKASITEYVKQNYPDFTPTPQAKAGARPVEKKEGAEPSGGVSWQQAMKSVLDLAEKDRPLIVTEQKKTRAERVGAMAGTMDWLRKKGVSGKEAIHKSAGKLKGALADYEGRYQPLFDILKPSTIEAAENDMADSDTLTPFDKISLTNHEGTGAWDKMLRGAAMTPGDVKLIRKWQPILAKEAAKRVPLSSRVWEGLEWMLGTLKFGAAFDVQIRRQARWLRGRHPVLFTKAVGRDLAAYISNEYANKMAKETTASPYHEQAQRYGLRFLNRQPKSSEQRPEQFVSNLPETLPWLGKRIGTGYKYTGGQVGRVYAASMRGFIDSFNWMQQKMWDMQIEKWKGQNVEITQKMLVDLVDFQNTMLGMSKPKTNFGGAVNRVMRPVMWSPSLTWSRIRTPSLMLSNPTMRGEVAASLSTYIGTGLMYLAAASMLARWWNKEDPVEWDINSSDFGKIRIGDTRWDIYGDGGPYIRALLQAWTGTKKNQAGRITTKEGFDKLDPFKQLLRNKRAPALDLFAKVWSGRNYYGGDAWALPDYDEMRKEGGTKEWFADWHEGQMEDKGKEVGFFISKEVYDRYMPFFIQGALEAAWNDGWPQAIGAGTDEFFSGQALSYKPSTNSELQIIQDIAATQEYDKLWDELTPKQQEKLYKQVPEMGELEMKKSAEKLPPEEISLTKQNRAAKRIFRAMPDDVKKEMNAIGVKISAPSRKIGKFFLSESRYTAYEEYSRQEIEKQLTKTIISKRYLRKSKAKRMEKLRDDIIEAKADARKRLLREINRGEL